VIDLFLYQFDCEYGHPPEHIYVAAAPDGITLTVEAAPVVAEVVAA